VLLRKEISPLSPVARDNEFSSKKVGETCRFFRFGLQVFSRNNTDRDDWDVGLGLKGRMA
jgi:hypothetical protein